MNSPIDCYAVIGNPIAHSRSPQIHALFATQTGQRLEYGRILSSPENFSTTVMEFIEQGGKGMNVTIPFKLDAFALVNQISSRAQLAGAVNTLTFSEGKISGDNTDGIGLVNDLRSNLTFDLQSKQILLLGAGGAARGVILPLLEAGVASLTIANRTLEKAQELASLFSPHGQVKACCFNELCAGFDLMINATSASLAGTVPDLPKSTFDMKPLAYDMMFDKDPTPFMVRAQQFACRTSDGMGMLVEQAAESFWIWRGVRPETTEVLAQLRNT